MYGNWEIEQEMNNLACYFFPTIEKLDRPFEASQSKLEENITIINVFKKFLTFQMNVI